MPPSNEGPWGLGTDLTRRALRVQVTFGSVLVLCRPHGPGTRTPSGPGPQPLGPSVMGFCPVGCCSSGFASVVLATPRGSRIPVASVKRRCPRPLDDGGGW